MNTVVRSARRWPPPLFELSADTAFLDTDALANSAIERAEQTPRQIPIRDTVWAPPAAADTTHVVHPTSQKDEQSA